MDTIKQAHYSLGTAYLNNKQYSEAVDAFQHAIALDENFAAAHGQMGLAYFELNDFENAAKAAKEALRNDSNYQPAHRLLETLKQEYYDLGLASLATEEYAPAILEFTQAIKIDAEFIEAIHALGLAYLGAQKFDEAKNAAQEALKIDTNYQPAKALLETINPAKEAEVAAQAHHKETEVAAQAPSSDVTASEPGQPPLPPETPLNPDATLTSSESKKHYEQGIAFLNNQQYNHGVAAFKKALNSDANYRDAHYGLGLAYLKVGTLDMAENAAQQALNIDENYLPAHQLLNDIQALDAKIGRRALWLKIGLFIAVLAGLIALFGIYKTHILNFLTPTPSAELSITEIRLDEPSANKFLDGGEKASINIKIENLGGRARGLHLQLTPSSYRNLRYNPSTTIQELDANSERIITIPISADRNVQAQAVLLKIQLLDKNGDALTVKKPFSFKTFPDKVPGPFAPPR